jgi:hypothetical protein
LFFTTAQLCKLTGVPVGTLKRLRSHGSVLAAHPGERGRGHSDLWTVEQALALAVARGLRSSGGVTADAEGVLSYLWGLCARDLERAFKKGRTCLMLVVTPQGTHCLPTLVCRDAILSNPAINDQKATAMSHGMSPSALDVEAIWRFLLQEANAVGVKSTKGSKTTDKVKRCVSGFSRTK